MLASLCSCLFSRPQGKAPAADTAGSGRTAGRSGSGLPPIVVNLNSSSSELKLLRVLQTLVNLSGKDAGGMRCGSFPMCRCPVAFPNPSSCCDS